MTVYRPVKASPPQMNEVVIDPKTGRFTAAGHRRITELWKRTGGFTDDVGALLGLISISQTSSLASASDQEKTRRMIGEALQQVQGQNVERLRSLFEDFRKTADTQFGQLLGGLARPPQTRVIEFTQNDTWRLNPDVRAIQAVAVGGGGGGAGGEVLLPISGTPSSSLGGGGGGGAGTAFTFFDVRQLPSSVSIVVGSGGAGGVGATSAPTASTNGSNGGASSFGPYLVAKGGSGGVTLGVGGAGAAPPGLLFEGGAGGADSAAAANLAQGAPGGGGGGTGGWDGTVVVPSAGGAGGAGVWRTASATGGGGAGGLAGASGSPGATAADSAVYLAPGYGGGGGGSSNEESGGNGGSGGDGVIGGGGGGGGGGFVPDNGGNGGAGGAGRVWVVEYY